MITVGPLLMIGLLLVGVNPAIACTSGEEAGGLVCDSDGKWVNSAGGNLYGDSRINPDANPLLNPDANPILNFEADPLLNVDADPRINPSADPDLMPGGDTSYTGSLNFGFTTEPLEATETEIEPVYVPSGSDEDSFEPPFSDE